MTSDNYLQDLLFEIENPIQSHMTQLPGQVIKGVKNTIAVASGKGGVGKSTVATNLAVSLARSGARVGILDADIYGPSIPIMLGANTDIKLKDNFYHPIYTHNVQSMSIGYLTEQDTPLIWRGPMLAKYLMEILNLTKWDNLDYLFIDLPPGTGDIQLSLVQKIPLTGAIIVTTPQTVATNDAQKALSMFLRTNIDILGVVENMSLHTCSACGHKEEIFGNGGADEICKKFNCQILGKLPLDKTIQQSSDEGKPIANKKDTQSEELAKIYIKIALKVALEIAKKPLNYSDRLPPIVSS